MLMAKVTPDLSYHSARLTTKPRRISAKLQPPCVSYTLQLTAIISAAAQM
jgi:hypothetical protein